MKRFASHYLYLQHLGFLKQFVVEVNDEGYVESFYPLQGESESIEWWSGVIALIPQDTSDLHKSAYPVKGEALFALVSFDATTVLRVLPPEYVRTLTMQKLYALRLYPFDYVQMKPVPETCGTLL